MNDKNNNEKIMEIFKSINEKYKIGEVGDLQLELTGDVYIKIKIDSFLFEFFMIKKLYNSINKDINDGNEKVAYNKISNFIVGCLEDIDIEYLFDGFYELCEPYEPYNKRYSPFELVDMLRNLEHKTNDIINNIKSKK